MTRRRPWRAVATVAALLALVAPQAAGATPGPVRARHVRLTSTTSVTWRGTAGIVLDVPRKVTLPSYGARLVVRGGTYAFVRISPTGKCGLGGPRCPVFYQLDYIRAMAPFRDVGDGPGTDHSTWIGSDRRLIGPTEELYLFTDGEATLTFERTGLPGGTTSYVAAGRIRGHAQEVPTTCPTSVGCTTRDGYGQARVGGMAYDVGSLGFADIVVSVYDRGRMPDGYWWPNHQSARACTYPRTLDDPTSPDPAAHPYGCDFADPDDTWDTVIDVTDTTSAHGSSTSNSVQTGNGTDWARGRVWQGFQLSSTVPGADSAMLAHGVWCAYGIS